MKKLLLILCSFCVIFSLVYYASTRGKSHNATVTIGDSNKFTQDEIQQAIKALRLKFKDFKYCELTSIIYDEQRSNATIDYLADDCGTVNGATVENTLVLISEIHTNSAGPDQGLEPNSIFDIGWTLTRENDKSPWIVYSLGNNLF